MAFSWDILLGPIFKIIDKVVPDVAERERQKAELQRMALAGELDSLKQEFELAKLQVGVNAEEAKDPGIFKGGWRPAVGWSCLAIGVWYPIARVLLPWGLKVAGVTGVPELPPLETTEAMTMLFGLLGLGTLRSLERLRGKA